MSVNVISKETIQRLLKDVKNIIKNPLTDNGIHYYHDEEDMMKGYALIIGPEDTPYFGGYYFFEFKFPSDYPHSPPKVTFCTNGENIRFNPNLYVCGKVCVSLLNTWRGDQWTSCQTISTVLLTLCSLLCNNPLLNEPGVNINHKDINKYNEIIEYSNINIAVCDVVNKKSGVLLKQFTYFYDIIKQHFTKVYSKHLEFIEKKTLKNKYSIYSITRLTTDFYRLDVIIDYVSLMNKLKDTYENLDKKDVL
jgi:ubiquitin-conjugating enzyme E2 Z